MHIVFQRPGLGADEHDYQWVVINGAGERVSCHYSPEAALISAEDAEGAAAGTLRLVRDGAYRFNVLPR